MSEYIGSRISLISKSDIKYVGLLQSIDSETATVSLKDVRCHGTEGRKANPDEELPASDVVYDGIVFRGSDVKDLTILAAPKENRPPQMPNDPAILGSGEIVTAQQTQQPLASQQQNQYRGPAPPYQQQQPLGYPAQPPNPFPQQSRFQGPGGPHGFPGQPGAVAGYGMGYAPPPPGYGNMGMRYGPPGQGFQGPPGPFSPQQQPIGPPGHPMNQHRPPQQPSGQPHQHQQPPIGSKQNTPQPSSQHMAPPPVSQQLTNPAEMSGTVTPPITGPPPPLESKPSSARAAAPPAPTQKQPQPPTAPATKPIQKISNRVAVPLAPGSPAAVKLQPKPQGPPQQASQQIPLPPQNATTTTESATAAVAAAMAKLSAVSQQGVMDNLTQKVNQLRVQDGQFRGRVRGRVSSIRGGRRESQQKTVEVPKEDFDFEGANAKFNKRDLVKEAVASGSPVTSPYEAAAPDPLVSAMNGHKEEDVVIPPKEKGYDKKSSFFDNISSDLKDRVELQQQGEMVDGRAMRREERTKNMETFGQGSVDSGYRGRGRGRGRGFGRGRGYYGVRGGYENTRGDTRGRGRGGADAAAV